MSAPKSHLQSSLICILLILAMLTLATGCQAAAQWLNNLLSSTSERPTSAFPESSKSENATTTDGSMTIPSQTAVSTTTASPFDIVCEGIRFETRLDQDCYQSNDIITVQVRITNTTAQAVPFWAATWSFGAAGSVSIQILLDGDADFPLNSADESVLHDCMILHDQLAAGACIEKTVHFTTQYRLDGATIAEAWSGTHQVVIQWKRGDDSNQPLQICVPLQISSTSNRWISGRNAVERAKATAEYSTWLADHSGTAIARQEGSDYFVNDFGTWTKTGEEFYKQITTNPVGVDGATSFRDGCWTVDFSVRLGDAPYHLLVTLDAQSGSILKVEAR
jgi:hypothetical protein